MKIFEDDIKIKSFENNKCAKYFCFEKNDFSCERILTNSMLKIFQVMATEHAENLGVGFKEMFEKNLLWVTLRTRFEILRKPEIDEKLLIVTYPSGKNFLEFDRDYLIFDQNDNLIVRGQSKWCLIDTKTRHIAKMIESPVLIDQKPIFESKFLKTLTFEIENLPDYRHAITQNDIDKNGHMNNTIYALLVDKMLERENFGEIKFFQINFVKEALLDDIMEVYYKRENDCIKIVGKLYQKTESFNAEVLEK